MLLPSVMLKCNIHYGLCVFLRLNTHYKSSRCVFIMVFLLFCFLARLSSKSKRRLISYPLDIPNICKPNNRNDRTYRYTYFICLHNNGLSGVYVPSSNVSSVVEFELTYYFGLFRFILRMVPT